MLTPSATIRSIRSHGYAPAGRGRQWQLMGQDGGQSVPLKDGRSLFLFSDTLLAPLSYPDVRNRGRFLANSAALSERGADSLMAAMAELNYFSDSKDEPHEILTGDSVESALAVRFWPEHGIQRGEEVVFFYLGIQQAAAGTWGFIEVGSGIARLDLRTGTCSRWMREGDWRPWPALPVDTHCGVQLMENDGWLLVFCSRPAGLEYEAFLARVPMDAIDQPEQYCFYAGEAGWTRMMTAAKPLTQCSSEFSVAYNEHLGCYVMTYVEGHTKQLCLRTAPQPWGPYSDALRAGVVPHREEAKIVSLGFQHPQFDREGGRTIYISYSQPHFSQNAIIELTFD